MTRSLDRSYTLVVLFIGRGTSESECYDRSCRAMKSLSFAVVFQDMFELSKTNLKNVSGRQDGKS